MASDHRNLSMTGTMSPGDGVGPSHYRGGVLSPTEQSVVTRPTSILHIFMTKSRCDQYNAGQF
jgi:hypothetical protein